ncbi:MAG: RluA family pseudouridine synthase [Bdellovibrionales bacterium]
MNSESKNTYLVDEDGVNQRLDLYIGLLHPDLSRSKIKKLIKNNLITVNDSSSKVSHSLSLGDRIEILSTIDEDKEVVAFQQDIPVEIIFEDDDLIVINKQVGLVTHPGAGNLDGTLVNALYNKLLHNDPIRPGVVHRLDKDTSGLLVLAKSQKAFDSLSEQFKNKEARRIYWAVSFGKMNEQSGTLKTKLARHPRNRKKFSSQENGKLAITHYKVLKEGALSLIELSLETGRTHQIRVHLSEIGHPILNDPIYSSAKKINDLHDPVLKSKAKKLKRLALVAKELSLKHPVTDELLHFALPYPLELEDLCS